MHSVDAYCIVPTTTHVANYWLLPTPAGHLSMVTCKYNTLKLTSVSHVYCVNEKNETLSEKISRFSGIVVYKLFDVYTKEAVWADGGKFDNRRVEDAHNREKSGRQL